MSKQQYTPGPWRWEINLINKHLNLVGGKIPYDLYVMDFVRWGMGGAIPRFNVDYTGGLNIMTKADEMATIIPERRHHANWFQTISHPDAQLIAAAPDLLEALQEILKYHSDKPTGLVEGHKLDGTPAFSKARSAIYKATNPDYKPDGLR